eukprot:ANDGO_07805.mRNA.1 Nuclear transport factor 2
MASNDQIAHEFVKYYYQTFENARGQLGALFGPQSVMTFEGRMFMGPEDIAKKLTSLPFASCVHTISTIDTQASPAGGLIVFVSGHISLDGANPLPFSEIFHLVPAGNSVCVSNNMFRFVTM